MDTNSLAPLTLLIIVPAVVAISLSAVGYPKAARNPHWQIAAALLLMVSLSALAGLHMHQAWDTSLKVQIAVKVGTWAVALLAMLAAIHAPLAVRTRGDRPDPDAGAWSPTDAVFQRWQLRHFIQAGAAMSAALIAMTVWSLVDPKFNQPVLATLLPAFTLVSILSILTGWQWYHAVTNRAPDHTGETSEETFRLDRQAIAAAQAGSRRNIVRWCDRITIIAMTTAAILLIAIISLASADRQADTALRPDLGYLAAAFLLAGTVTTMVALTHGAGNFLRPATWTVPAILQAAGIAAIVAALSLPQVTHDATAGLLPVAAFIVAGSAGLAMGQRIRRQAV